MQEGSRGAGANTKSRFPHGRDAERSYHGGRDVGRPYKIGMPKVAGPDGVRPAIVKPLAKVLLKPCTWLFNSSLDEKRRPADWLMSTFTPLHKSGDRNNCDYTSRSLTPSTLNNLENAIRDKIVKQLEANNVMVIGQNGFKRNRFYLTK